MFRLAARSDNFDPVASADPLPGRILGADEAATAQDPAEQLPPAPQLVAYRATGRS
jgi:hypothetical protein